ncbi:integrase, partial [Brucella oryzae]
MVIGPTPWTYEDVAKIYEKLTLGTMARLALDLLLVAGQRRTDV